MFWVSKVLLMECVVCGGVVNIFPGLPRVMGSGEVLPTDKVVITIVRADSGVKNTVDDVFLLSIDFNAWWRILRLLRMTLAYWFQEVDMEDRMDVH